MAQITTAEGIVLEYDTFGSPSEAPLLLVAGLGAQMIAWAPAFCEQLAAGGHFVIRFDNRDCGRSSKLDGEDAHLTAILAAAAVGDLEEALSLAPYTLSAMSEDACTLLRALDIERAHVVGASMGAMIAQTLAIEHPERMRSLTSMMSSTGEREFGQSTKGANEALLTPAPSDRAGYIEAAKSSLIWASKRYADLSAIRELASASYDRGYYPEGVTRQLAAMMASGSRAERLRALRVPTLVIHGLDDTLIAPSGGERTAALIPGARLLLLEDMGHDRPPALWPEICGAILAHTARRATLAQPAP